MALTTNEALAWPQEASLHGLSGTGRRAGLPIGATRDRLKKNSRINTIMSIAMIDIWKSLVKAKGAPVASFRLHHIKGVSDNRLILQAERAVTSPTATEDARLAPGQ
jgi:hypothetical protein